MSVRPLHLALLRARLVALLLVIGFAAQSSFGPGLVAAAVPVDGFAPTATRAAASAPSVEPRLGAALRNALARARRHSAAPGLSMAIVTDDGRVWQRASGRGRDGGRLSARAPQTIASITKAFTAAIVMQLASEGRIELDAPANRYLPKVALLRGVTVRQLLAHRSGIADLYGPAKHRLNHRPGRALGSNDVLRPIGPRWFAPGKDYGYSNTNYFLLGHIIEVVTHSSFNDVLAERITGPLELDDTRLLTADDTQLPPAWSTAFWTSGAMVATPADLAEFGHALYGGGLVSDRHLARMTSFKHGNRYGLGTQLLPLGSRDVPGHSGLLYTTTSLLVHLPKERVTIAIFGTAPNADLEAALVERYGGRSLLDLALSLAG